MMGPEFDAEMQRRIDEALDVTMLQKLIRIGDMLHSLQGETQLKEYTRSEAVQTMKIIERMQRCLSHIECDVVEKHFHDDMDRLTTQNAAEIINDYSSGFYRSEIRGRWRQLQEAELPVKQLKRGEKSNG